MRFLKPFTPWRNGIAVGWSVGGALALWMAIAPRPAIAAAQSGPLRPAATPHLLEQMFPKEIRTALRACLTRGGVDFAVATAGPSSDAVPCRDGSRETAVSFAVYVETLADFLSAGFALGVWSSIQADERMTPERFAASLADPEGARSLREVLHNSLTTSRLLPASAPPEATPLLADRVMERLLPLLTDAQRLTHLTGTPAQYSQVVSQFCQAPGTSLAQAQRLLPDLSPVQFYAVCLQEAGILNSQR